MFFLFLGVGELCWPAAARLVGTNSSRPERSRIPGPPRSFLMAVVHPPRPTHQRESCWNSNNPPPNPHPVENKSVPGRNTPSSLQITQAAAILTGNIPRQPEDSPVESPSRTAQTHPPNSSERRKTTHPLSRRNVLGPPPPPIRFYCEPRCIYSKEEKLTKTQETDKRWGWDGEGGRNYLYMWDVIDRFTHSGGRRRRRWARKEEGTDTGRERESERIKYTPRNEEKMANFTQESLKWLKFKRVNYKKFLPNLWGIILVPRHLIEKFKSKLFR